LLYGDKKYSKIISYGGVQSNAMHSLSYFAKDNGIEFVYLLKSIPQYLKNTPLGNYKDALENGTTFVELGYEDFYTKISGYQNSINDSEIFIPQGGYCKESEMGVKILAEEIDSFAKNSGIEEANIILSSGTGTTALYLQKNSRFDLYTTPSVGGVAFLEGEFKGLEPNLDRYPKVIETSKKFRFGEPKIELLEKYLELKEMGLEVDLMYDTKLFLAFDENFERLTKKKVIFVHSGGLSGNKSMLSRYKERFNLANI